MCKRNCDGVEISHSSREELKTTGDDDRRPRMKTKMTTRMISE